jgi:putative ABC transport system ATP-binding protein
MDILGNIHHEGNTVIIVTHEDDISKYCHRIIRLRDGIVETDRKNESPSAFKLETINS